MQSWVLCLVLGLAGMALAADYSVCSDHDCEFCIHPWFNHNRACRGYCRSTCRMPNVRVVKGVAYGYQSPALRKPSKGEDGDEEIRKKFYQEPTEPPTPRPRPKKKPKKKKPKKKPSKQDNDRPSPSKPSPKSRPKPSSSNMSADQKFTLCCNNLSRKGRISKSCIKYCKYSSISRDGLVKAVARKTCPLESVPGLFDCASFGKSHRKCCTTGSGALTGKFSRCANACDPAWVNRQTGADPSMLRCLNVIPKIKGCMQSYASKNDLPPQLS